MVDDLFGRAPVYSVFDAGRLYVTHGAREREVVGGPTSARGRAPALGGVGVVVGRTPDDLIGLIGPYQEPKKIAPD